METSFKSWLSFKVTSETAINDARIINALFQRGIVSSLSFSTYERLNDTVRFISQDNEYYEHLFNDVKNISKSSLVTTTTIGTLKKKLYAIENYIEFLGYKYPSFRTDIKRISKVSSHLEESQKIWMYLNSNITVNRIDHVLNALRQRQKFIEQSMLYFIEDDKTSEKNFKWMKRNFVPDKEVKDFISKELVPFIYFMLVLDVFPFEPVDFKNMIYTPLPIDKKKAEAYLIELNKHGKKTKKRRIPLLYWDRKRLSFIRIVNDYDGDNHRFSNITLPLSVSIYVGFYLFFSFTMLVHEKKVRYYPLFNVYRHVPAMRKYAIKIGINVSLFDWLSGYNFGYTTKLLWAYNKILRKGKFIQPDILSHYLVVAGIAMSRSQTNKHYHGLDDIRENADAINFFDMEVPNILYTDRTLKMTSHALYIAMSSRILLYTAE
jgi:hypothetical protein